MSAPPMYLYEVQYQGKYYLTYAYETAHAKDLVAFYLKDTLHLHPATIRGSLTTLPARDEIIDTKEITSGFWGWKTSVRQYAKTLTEPQVIMEYYF